MNNDKKELTKALTVFRETSFDIVDCILCVKAKEYGLTLFPFDKALAKRAGKG